MEMRLKKWASLLLCGLSASAFAELPKVTILATGGTIAGAGKSAVGATYEPGQLTIQTLIEAVPEMQELAAIKGEQVANIGSPNITGEIWLNLAKTVNAQCAETDGFVITHGTDTIEETAYFLNLTVKCDKPVVLVGSMRPATEKSADGPLNLYNAVVVATDKASAGRGVLLVLNDQVFDARDVTKSHTTSVQTFVSPNYGPLGAVYDGKVDYFRTPVHKHTTQTPFNVDELNELPKVGVIYAHVDMPLEPIHALADAGYKGIIGAGMGNGSLTKASKVELEKVMEKGVVVVRSARTASGPVTPDVNVDKAGYVISGTLNPQKARILLQLALTKTSDVEEIRRYFKEY